MHLLKPLQVGSLELANRLVMPPMATAKAKPDGKVSQDVLATMMKSHWVATYP